jgi:mono/diheme cytochrome c family protein
VKNRSIRRGIPSVLATLALVSAGFISRSADRSVAAATEQPPANAAASYAQVASILQERCASCHNPQGGAPFNLLNYEDAKQWSGQVLEVTQSRYMPPWLPAPGKGEFAGERRLSDAELATIRAWVGAGAPGTDETGLGKAAHASETSEWPLGKPDAVLTLSEPVALPGNGPDVFTNLVVPFPGNELRSLRAIQIRPSDPQAVRGVLVSFDESGRLRQTDGWKQGIAGMELPDSATPGPAGLIFWMPGSQALKPGAGESWAVKPGSNLLLTAHLKTTGKKIALQFQIGLYYEPKGRPGSARAAVLTLRHRGPIEIPAAASSINLGDSYKLPQPVSVTAIYPRAHFLARSFDAYATTPSGKQVWLLSIPKWDVDWVEVYQYRRPVILPRGSVIHWKVGYDNSAENPHNPSDPPVAVHAGTGAADEADALLLEMEPAAGTNAVVWRKAIEAAAK